MPKKIAKKTTRRSPQTSSVGIMGRMTIASVRLVSIHGNLQVASGQPPDDSRVKLRVEFSCSGNPQQNTFLSDVTLVLEGSASEKGSSIDLSIRYQVVFQMDEVPTMDEVSKEDFDLIHTASVHIAWPYIRETTQSITSKMGQSPLVLPLVQDGSINTRPQP